MDKIEHNITTAQAAKILRIHPGTLANWRANGIGPAFQKTGDRKNASVLYNREELREFAKSMKKTLSRR